MFEFHCYIGINFWQRARVNGTWQSLISVCK